MKTFQIASVIALASVAVAQLDNIPQCALSCFVGPLTSDGCASLTDFACHCKQGAALVAAVLPCVQGACSTDETNTAVSTVQAACKAAGVPIVIPDTSSPPATTPEAPAPPAVSSAEAVVSSAEAAISSAYSAASASASSLAGAVSSVLANATSASVSLTYPSASSVPEFTGAAAQATGAAVLMGAAAFAMLL